MIETSSALAELAARIGGNDRVGIDTEADSLHCYREKVCLVQVGLPDADELVDPLAGLDLSPLLDALSSVEIVMHGADFDLTKDQQRQVAALRQQRDRTAAELAINAELIAPRAALERIAIEGGAGLDALLPWQQELLHCRD